MTTKTTLLTIVCVLTFSSSIAFAEQPEVTDQDQTEATHDRHDHEGHKRKHKKMREHRKQMAEQRLQEIDQNNDQQVDLNEYLSHAETRFNSLDSNDDGFVTKEEARERHRELRKKHRMKRKQMRDELDTETAPDF